MKYLLYFVSIFFFVAGCKTFAPPKSIPAGTWNYKLFMNGTQMGTASLTSAETSVHYISTIVMSIEVAGAQSTTKEILTETKTFVPVKFEAYNQVITNGIVQNMDTVAVFNGKEITVSSQGQIARVIIDKPFVLPGNYLTKALLDKGYVKSSLVEAEVYNPLLELEDTVLIRQEVLGIEIVEINGVKEELLHIREIIVDFQQSDMYIDSSGVPRKISALMLNNLLELVIEK